MRVQSRVALIAVLMLPLLSFGRSKSQPQSTDSNAPLPVLIETIRPMVVQVIVRVRGQVPAEFNWCFQGRTSCIMGTGFFVNSDGYVVTAFHVAEGFVSVGPDGKPVPHPGVKEIIAAAAQIGSEALVQIGVAIPNVEMEHLTVASGTNYFDAKVVATDPEHDLALIQAVSNPFTRMPLSYAGKGAEKLPQATAKSVRISTSRPKDGEAIFGCGYPLMSYGQVCGDGKVASAWNTEVLIRPAAAGFNRAAEVYEVDLRENPGNSGGPVFRSSDQAVIGVDVQTFGSLAIIIPAKFVSAFLDANKISWQSASNGHSAR